MAATSSTFCPLRWLNGLDIDINLGGSRGIIINKFCRGFGFDVLSRSEVDRAGESRGAEGEGDENLETHAWFAGSWLDVRLVE